MLGKESTVFGIGKDVKSTYVFTMAADGLIRIDDTLRSTSDEIFSPVGHVSDLSLISVLKHPNVKEYFFQRNKLPEECTDCVWNKVCHGGDLVNRFSREKRFNNKTVFCSSMKLFLSRAASHLMATGIDEKTIMDNIQK
jgi:uncharacterized protein